MPVVVEILKISLDQMLVDDAWKSANTLLINQIVKIPTTTSIYREIASLVITRLERKEEKHMRSWEWHISQIKDTYFPLFHQRRRYYTTGPCLHVLDPDDDPRQLSADRTERQTGGGRAGSKSVCARIWRAPREEEEEEEAEEERRCKNCLARFHPSITLLSRALSTRTKYFPGH